MPYYIQKMKAKQTEEGKKAARKPRKSPSLQTLVDKLDKVFSRFIRLRDAMPGGLFRCISCGRIKPIGQADCGHFHSRRHMSTRFDEDNCHAECRACNRFSADHIIGYRENLIRKIGEQRYLLLDLRAHGTRKWSRFELEQLTKHYKALGDKLSKDKGIKL